MEFCGRERIGDDVNWMAVRQKKRLCPAHVERSETAITRQPQTEEAAQGVKLTLAIPPKFLQPIDGEVFL